MGYDFSQAVADIVDNSVEAKSTVVAIDVEFDGDDSWVRIADDGKGMTPEELREAMRYGANREYVDDDLGKFGLGLKTASMSQCQLLSVASRWNPDRSDIAAYAWDLDHIERTNRWEVLPIERSLMTHAVREPLKDNTGTVVLWERLDRVLGFKHPYGEMARKRLSQTCREIELHLGMVFHRFLAGELRRKRLKLLLNGNEIRPWDPFCRTEPKTKPLQPVRIPVEHDGVTGEVLIEPYVLPHQDDFSSPEAFRHAGGPSNWNQQQGFYIYRAGRMIQSGGWSNLRSPDEHMKLARVAVSFSPALDAAFKINVAKMRVQMPSQIREAVRQAIGPVMKLAREVYDRKAARTIVTGPPTTGTEPGTPIPPAKTESPQPSAAKPGSSVQLELFTFEDWAQRALAAATPEEWPVVHAILGRMRKKQA
jgi:hypothetical protein